MTARLDARAETIIPIVDLAAFDERCEDEALRKQVAQELLQAMRNVGFVYLRNVGISQEIIDEMFAWSKRFFALPDEIKMKAPHPPEGWYHRGYSGVGKEQVTQMVFDRDELDKIRQMPGTDLKESFDMGRMDAEKAINIWLPESDLPGFRTACETFFIICREKAQARFMAALELGMGLEPGHLKAYHRTGENQLRLLHYPSAPAEVFADGRKVRSAAHTDFGSYSFLFQDAVGGLEVEDVLQPGVFKPAPYIPGTVVCNIGDLLQRWSNDQLKSTLHRVRAPSGPSPVDGWTPERFSIPYFCTADFEKTINTLPTCVSEANPSKYEPINAGEYINMRLNANY